MSTTDTLKKVGRPAVGRRTTLRLPDDVYERIDQARGTLDRSQWIRLALTSKLADLDGARQYPPRRWLDSLESFATVVKQERILRMMTQEELAARSEVSLAVVQAAEAAAGGLNLGQARKLLRALDVEPVVMPAEFVSGGQL